MLRIVTDGSVDMPEEWKDRYAIDVIPLRLVWGDESYTQGIDITPEMFYRFVLQKRTFPKTSLPSPQQVVEFYRTIARRGDDVLSIHVGSQLSGTYAIIQMAAREAGADFKVHPFDSNAGSAALGFMCQAARIDDRAGLPVQAILEHLEEIRQRITVIFTIDTLEFAYLSGRINALQSAISSALKIKPIVVLKDGLLEMAEKVRTRQRAVDRVLEKVRQRVGDQKINLAVVHAADPAMAEKMTAMARQLFNIHELVTVELSIPVAAHLGPGAIGIVAYPVC
ncbi:MAG: DegV family protein [Chloroflexi bacterium]|nr:DegV family protein [Anaerolineaceae bacterium]NMB87036.1 DegV family protein [Chloroflexota bacterium]